MSSINAILESNHKLEFLDTPGVVTQEMVEKFKLSNEVISGEFLVQDSFLLPVLTFFRSGKIMWRC